MKITKRHLSPGACAASRLRGAGHQALSGWRLRVWLAVHDLTLEHGYPPTLGEIGAVCGGNKSAILVAVRRLRAIGLLDQPGCRNQKRGITTSYNFVCALVPECLAAPPPKVVRRKKHV